ncbi:MAG: tetratricopeptide repeat protein [Vibrio sp.]|uniref:tetratricopeptide repeat protein n=1 Tax=Vibrio sp. TaxID=678 RepID=UPI003F3D2952
MENISEIFANFENLIPLFNGQSIKEQAGISDDDINNLHAIACDFYDKGKLNEAEQFFQHLCLLDSTNIDYILGLGAVLQKKKLYSKAVDIYAAGHMVQKNDSRPMFYAGQCNFFDRKYAKARHCFEVVIKDNHSKDLTTMAEMFIDSMNEGKI